MRGSRCLPTKNGCTGDGRHSTLPRISSAFQHENRQFYVVPKDVRAIYQELATASFLARKKRDNLIHSYAMAAVNLYGVIRQDDLITIFNSQNSKKLAEAELFPTLLRHIASMCGYVLWRNT